MGLGFALCMLASDRASVRTVSNFVQLHSSRYWIQCWYPRLCLTAGSSFAWEQYRESGADNLVPIEIALRVVHAIDHDERFAAYLVIPLHPERPGPQRSSILLYTWHTIAMMYRYMQHLQCLVLLLPLGLGHNHKHWTPVSAWLMLFGLLTVPALRCS